MSNECRDEKSGVPMGFQPFFNHLSRHRIERAAVQYQRRPRSVTPHLLQPARLSASPYSRTISLNHNAPHTLFRRPRTPYLLRLMCCLASCWIRRIGVAESFDLPGEEGCIHEGLAGME